MNHQTRLRAAFNAKPGEVWLNTRKHNEVVIVRNAPGGVVIRNNRIFALERSCLHNSLAKHYRPLNESR